MTAMNIDSKKLKEMIDSKKTFLVDFWAPWCPHCRKINPAYETIAEQYAGTLEVVKLDMDEDENLWDELNVELIPTIRLYVDGLPVSSTVAPESKAAIDEFLSGLLPEQKKESEDRIYDMVIIGGGPGGYTAALYAARAGLDTLVIERLSAGGQMALTHQIDNYPGFEDGVDGFELSEKMQRQAHRFGAKTEYAEVQRLELDRSPKLIHSSAGLLQARTVVIATGAGPRELGLENEKSLMGRGLAYCAACDGMFYKGKTVVLVGGGNSAAEDALILSRVAKKVILVHRRDSLKADKVYHQPLMEAENVELRWNSAVEELLHDERIKGVRIRNLKSGEESILDCEGVFVSIGRKPATALVEGQLELDEGGYIVAGETTATNIPGVFAVGMCAPSPCGR